MDFELDPDQLELQAAAASVLAAECPPTLVRAVIAGGDEDVALWQTLCSLDWPGLSLPVEDGGSGMTAVELAIVVEQLGHVADPTAFLSTLTAFAPVVSRAADADQRHRWLSGIAEGRTGTLAVAGADGRWDPSAPPVQGIVHDDGLRLQGTARWVLDGDRADEVAVLVATADGPVVAVVPGASVGARRIPCIDGSLHLADVAFDDVVVPADRVLTGTDGAAAVTFALEEACTGAALAIVGACQRALDLVIAHVKVREQFGVPIGSFQAVKHKAVNVHIAIERARAVGQFAALARAEGDPRAAHASSMAKAAAGDAERQSFRDGIQLFGGLGFTWENDVQLYLRRAQALALLFGTTQDHHLRLGRALLDGPTRPTEVITGAAAVR